jgi:hypothetical protein
VDWLVVQGRTVVDTCDVALPLDFGRAFVIGDAVKNPSI